MTRRSRVTCAAPTPCASDTPAGLTPAEFTARWAERLALYASMPTQVDAASVARLVLEEFAAVERALASEALTLAEAAAEAGLSVAHVGRLVREAHVPNAGSKHRPRVRRADLPAPQRQRARGLADSETPASYDPEADAAQVRRRA